MIAELARRHTVVAPVAPGFNDVDELDEVRDVHDLALHYDDLSRRSGSTASRWSAIPSAR